MLPNCDQGIESCVCPCLCVCVCACICLWQFTFFLPVFGLHENNMILAHMTQTCVTVTVTVIDIFTDFNQAGWIWNKSKESHLHSASLNATSAWTSIFFSGLPTGGVWGKKKTHSWHTHTVHGGPWREYLHVTFSLQTGIVLQKTCRETCLNRFWE